MKQLKITVSMLQRHVAEIDRWRVNMRIEHHAKISRSAVIRALIDLAMAKESLAANTAATTASGWLARLS